MREFETAVSDFRKLIGETEKQIKSLPSSLAESWPDQRGKEGARRLEETLLKLWDKVYGYEMVDSLYNIGQKLDELENQKMEITLLMAESDLR